MLAGKLIDFCHACLTLEGSIEIDVQLHPYGRTSKGRGVKYPVLMLEIEYQESVDDNVEKRLPVIIPVLKMRYRQ